MSLPHDVEIVLQETTAQDLLLDLGTPLRKYWKEDDRLDRVWGAERNGGDAQANACFWNYFQHGLDLLVVDGVVTKIIAHSNIVSEIQQLQLTLSSLVHQSSSNMPAARGSCLPTRASSTSPPPSQPSGRSSLRPRTAKPREWGATRTIATSLPTCSAPSPVSPTPATAAEPERRSTRTGARRIRVLDRARP